MENDRFILNRNSDVKVTYIGTGQFQLASGKCVDAILYKYKKVYEITLYLMFNREFMNDVYRTFRIISRGL